MENVTLNHEQRLYVMEHEEGYSCYGFDVLERKIYNYANFAGVEVVPHQVGTPEAYAEYQRVAALAAARHRRTGERCLAELTPQLVGLEGKIVEVEDADGETRRFRVGRSTGWMPIHLEVDRGEDGGPGAMGPYKSVRVVNRWR